MRVPLLRFLLCPFDTLARRADGRYASLARGRRELGPLALLEYAGIFSLGAISGRLGLSWAWAVALAGWVLAGLLDPLLWRRVYGKKVGRGTSLLANLDAVYLFLLGWAAQAGAG
jgi:hypothetical protein